MNPERHKLEKIESRLYSRTETKDARFKEHPLEKKTWETSPSWELPPEDHMAMKKKTSNPFQKLLFASFGFFAFAMLVTVFMFMRGGNSVSADNIKITVGGPIQIGGAQELSLDVGVENNNSVPLELVDLVIDYPSGTKSAADLRTDLKRERVNLGDVKSGGYARRIFKAALFGEEGSTQDIKVSMEYRVPGSNAIFEKEKVFSILLTSSPVAITTKGLKEVTAGQATDFEVTVTSNSETEVKDVLLKAEYPFGYSFKSSDPQPSSGKDTWLIGTLKPKEAKTIKIKGNLQGQNDEERYFKFSAGNSSKDDQDQIATVLAISSQSVSIKRPFISLDLVFDNNTSSNDVAVRNGSPVNGLVEWVNTTNTTVANAEFTVSFVGTGFDKASVVPTDGGFYDSTKNTITWNRRTTDALAELKPGQRGRLPFSFTARAPGSKEVPNVRVAVSVKGDRVGEDAVLESIVAQAEKVVKITTDLRLAAKALHFIGPFENSGPMPPKADTETTYTIVWTVTNTTNNTSNVKVRAILPSYVSWKNLITPTTEKVSYDPVSGEVVWDLGNVPALTGFSLLKREVSFQIGVRPSLSQVGTNPIIIGSQTLSGNDNFADAEIKDTRNPLTTRLVGDTGFSDSDEKVVP